MIDENLAALLEYTLPKPPTVSSMDEERIDCGICYAQHLPVGRSIDYLVVK